MDDSWLRNSFETLMAPHKEGILFKKSTAWPHQWKKRFAVISTKGEFLLYKDQQEHQQHLQHSIRIRLWNSCATYGPKDGEIKLNYCNDTSTPIDTVPEQNQKSLLLKTQTESEREDWIQMIQKAILFAKHMSNNHDNDANGNGNSTHDEDVMASPSFLDRAKKRMSLVAFGPSQQQQQQQNTLQVSNGTSKNPFRRLSVYLTGKGKSAPTTPLTSVNSPEKRSTTSSQQRNSRRKSVMLFLQDAFNGAKEEQQQQKPMSLVEQYYQEEERKERERRERTLSDATTSGPKNSRISGISVDAIDQVNSMEALQKLIFEADEQEKRKSMSQAAEAAVKQDNDDLTLSDSEDVVDPSRRRDLPASMSAGGDDNEDDDNTDCDAKRSSHTVDKLKQLSKSTSLFTSSTEGDDSLDM